MIFYGVISRVFRPSHYFKIFYSIVVSNVVFVVHQLTSFKFSSKMFFHYKPMFVSFRRKHPNISLFSISFSIIPRWIVGAFKGKTSASYRAILSPFLVSPIDINFFTLFTFLCFSYWILFAISSPTSTITVKALFSVLVGVILFVTVFAYHIFHVGILPKKDQMSTTNRVNLCHS